MRTPSEIEKIEIAFQRVLDHISIQPHETGIETVLKMLIEQMQKIRAEWPT